MASILKYRLLDIDNNADEKFSSECKKYFTRVGRVELNKGIGLLTEIIDLFEESAA